MFSFYLFCSGQVQADEEEEEERLDEFGAWLESGAAEQPPEKI